jgi:chemotaxis protein CheY-P-specific phosphatase CheC
MIGDINEDEFKKKIQQRDKARQRKGEILQVLEMYTTVLSDLFQGFVSSPKPDEFIESLDELRSHFNTTMLAVSNRYSKCAIPVLTENFDMH